MQIRSLLQLLAPSAFAALLFGCGSDDAGGPGDDPVEKKDAGSKKRDAGSKTTESAKEPTDDEDDEDEADDKSPVADAGVHKGGKVEITGDSEDIACEKDSECPADEDSDSVGCCDQPTKVCFMSEGPKCPKTTGTGISQPAYN